MKFVLMYTAMLLLIAASDNIERSEHTPEQRLVRAFFWPVTLWSWLNKQPIQLHRLLTNLWIVLIAGWMLSLIADRIP